MVHSKTISEGDITRIIYNDGIVLHFYRGHLTTFWIVIDSEIDRTMVAAYGRNWMGENISRLSIDHLCIRDIGIYLGANFARDAIINELANIVMNSQP